MPRKNKPGAGRPNEGREKLTCYVKTETMAAINSSIGGETNTKGKVIDAWNKARAKRWANAKGRGK